MRFAETKGAATRFQAPIPRTDGVLRQAVPDHESKGVWAEEFTSMFQRQVCEKFKEHIGDYNELVTKGDFTNRLTEGIQSLKDKYTIAEVEKLASAVRAEFSIIDV